MKNPRISTAALVLFGTFAAFSLNTAQAVEGANIGDRSQCVRLQAVGQTPVIDDSTILVEMKGGGYRRIDLVQPCLGLKIEGGFAFDTSTQDICTSTGLRVLRGGGFCMIKDIITISKDEAKALKAKH